MEGGHGGIVPLGAAAGAPWKLGSPRNSQPHGQLIASEPYVHNLLQRPERLMMDVMGNVADSDVGIVASRRTPRTPRLTRVEEYRFVWAGRSMILGG